MAPTDTVRPDYAQPHPATTVFADEHGTIAAHQVAWGAIFAAARIIGAHRPGSS